MCGSNPIGFHAERKRRVLEKEVRLTDGQILCRSMPRVCFLFNLPLPFSPPPSVSFAVFDTHASQRAVKAKTQQWKERDGGITKEEGGRREGGARNGEV